MCVILGNDFGGVMNITFESGDSTSSGPRCLNISTTGDTFLEGDETLVLTLTTLNPRVIISPDTHTLTIQDNDSKYVNYSCHFIDMLYFVVGLNLTVTGGGNVAEGDMISVCAQFNAVTMRSVVVNFTTVGVTATGVLCMLPPSPGPPCYPSLACSWLRLRGSDHGECDHHEWQ